MKIADATLRSNSSKECCTVLLSASISHCKLPRDTHITTANLTPRQRSPFFSNKGQYLMDKLMCVVNMARSWFCGPVWSIGGCV